MDKAVPEVSIVSHRDVALEFVYSVLSMLIAKLLRELFYNFIFNFQVQFNNIFIVWFYSPHTKTIFRMNHFSKSPHNFHENWLNLVAI